MSSKANTIIVRFAARTVMFMVLYVPLHLGVALSVPEILPSVKTYKYTLGRWGFLYNRIKEAQGMDEVDVLFIGSSHAYRGFDVRLFAQAGYESFNLGSSAQTPVKSLYLLERYLSRLDPKIVIMEVCRTEMTNNGYESTLDIIANDGVNNGSALMALRHNNAIMMNSLLYAFLQQLSRRAESYKAPERMRDDVYVAGGYVETSRAACRVDSLSYPAEPLRSDQLKAMEDIARMLMARKVRLITVSAPSLYKNNHDASTQELSSILARYSVHIDANKYPVCDVRTDYYDASHLTQAGVTKFNTWLIRELEHKGVFRNVTRSGHVERSE